MGPTLYVISIQEKTINLDSPLIGESSVKCGTHAHPYVGRIWCKFDNDLVKNDRDVSLLRSYVVNLTL